MTTDNAAIAEKLSSIHILSVVAAVILAVILVVTVIVVIRAIREQRRIRRDIGPIRDLIDSRMRSARESAHPQDNSPEQTADAKVIAKRTYVWGRHSHTVYYATFQTAERRLELMLPGTEFGMLAEGDTGRLTYRGTRFVRFEQR